MMVLGIDPGSRITGYGIVDQEGHRLRHIDNGCIVAGDLPEFSHRLRHIYEGVTGVIHQYRPDMLAIEEVFFSANVQSALKLGQARGVAIVAAVNAGLPVYEYSASQIKQAVVGHGRAAKEQVQRMVKALLNLPDLAQADASDALAAAICHIHSARMTAIKGKR